MQPQPPKPQKVFSFSFNTKKQNTGATDHTKMFEKNSKQLRSRVSMSNGTDMDVTDTRIIQSARMHSDRTNTAHVFGSDPFAQRATDTANSPNEDEVVVDSIRQARKNVVSLLQAAKEGGHGASPLAKAVDGHLSKVEDAISTVSIADSSDEKLIKEV